MISFKEFLNEAQVNSHMTHLSDLVFLGGVDGTRKAVNYLRDLRNMFGHAEKNQYTVKFDGAPAVVCGIDPTDGKFFVAKKGIFNKTPVVYKTQADIDADLSGELKDKFTLLLKYLPELGIKSGIYQGDLMFSKSDLRKEKIDGQDMIVFHPNTIAYAVPADTKLGATIQAAEIGIVFHTTYTGDSFANMSASFGKNIVDKFSKSKNVWAIDATIDDKTQNFALDTKTYMMTEMLLKDIGIQFQRMNSGLLNAIHQDEELRSLVLIYINSLIRQNMKDLTPRYMSEHFYIFIHNRYEKEIGTKKMEKSKAALVDKRSRVLQFFDKYDHAEIASIFELAKSIDSLKDLLLTKMRTVSGLKHFLRTKDGFLVTNPEGFVAIASGEAVKLVDRFEFSRANFDSTGTILKGWMK